MQGLALAQCSLAWVSTLPGVGDLPKGYRLFDESVEIARRTGDPYAMAKTFSAVGFCREKPLHEKERLLEEARALAAQTAYPELLATAHYHTSWVYLVEKQFEKALPFAVEALRIGEAAQDPWTIYNAKYYLIWAHMGLGHHPEAKEVALGLLEQCAESGCLSYFCTSLMHLATIARSAGKPEVAARLVEARESIANPAKTRVMEEEWQSASYQQWHPQIDRAAFDRGYSAGFAMTLGDVLKYAQAEFGHAAS